MSAQVRYVPFDLPGAVRRFFARLQPRLAVIFETELWPNLYRECGRQRVPLVLASARLSARSVSRYRRLGALFRDTLAQPALIAAQGEGDAERFRALGADTASTHVTGNLKFDFELPADIAARGARLRQQYAADAAAVGRGQHARGRGAGGARGAAARCGRRTPGRCWCWRRVIRRASREVAQAARRGGRELRAALTGRRTQRRRRCDEVLLLDTLGELLDFYAAADLAFVGGSLVPVGGHNLLEPAALGVPILTGPYTSTPRRSRAC